MNIRKSTLRDLTEIKAIYSSARRFMKESGNPNQWGDYYPDDALIASDISEGCSYLVTEGEAAVAVFYFRDGEDRAYDSIHDGEWLNAAPYGVIHRVAVGVSGRGVAGRIFSYCKERCSDLKIDTHRDNTPMQRSLLKNGFRYCGIIYLENGEERLAYQWSREMSPEVASNLQ